MPLACIGDGTALFTKDKNLAINEILMQTSAR